MAAPDLTDRALDDTYKDLLQVSNSNAGIDGTLRPVRDGEGTASALSLSTGAASIAGTLAVSGTTTLGGGAALTAVLSASAALDFPSIASLASADLTLAVTGAATGNLVVLGLPASPTAGIVFQAFVSAADTVTVRATNITGGAVDPASAAYRVLVVKV